MFLAYILMQIFLILIFFRTISRIKKTYLGITPIYGWITGLFYFIVVPLTVIILNKGYTIRFGVKGYWASVNLSDPSNFISFLIIWLVLILCNLVILFPIPIGKAMSKRTIDLNAINIERLKKILKITMLISLMEWGLSIWFYGGLSSYLLEYWYTRGQLLFIQYGQWYILIQYISIANKVIFVASAGLYVICKIKYKNKLLKDLIVYFIALFMIIDMILSGNRINIAIFGLFLLASFYQYNFKKRLLMLLMILPFALLFFSLWPSIRGTLTNLDQGFLTHRTRLEIEDNSMLVTIFDGLDGSGVLLLFHVIRDFGDKYDFLYGASYLRLFTSFLPRNIFPEKSRNFSVILADIFEPGGETSFSATILGETYANFGYFCIFILTLITFIISKITEASMGKHNPKILRQAVIFLLLLNSMRYGFSVIAIVSLIALAPLWIFRIDDKLFNLDFNKNREVRDSDS